MKMKAFLELAKKERLLAVIRGASAEQAIFAAKTAFESGLNFVEVALTTPGGLEAIARLRREGFPIGAGTVLSREDGENAILAGATFLVSPHFDPSICCLQEKVPVIPGAATPTEIMAAHKMGVPLIKVFPSNSFGAAPIRMLLDPFPFLNLLCTGGIGEENMRDYLDAGAVAVGLASALFPRSELRQGDSAALRRRLSRVSEALRLS
jgi:2-dehydro-3-deoxyphosphogluconate aldolase/(4S)-4-hydroxy-2-oxoglutarate aldolase